MDWSQGDLSKRANVGLSTIRSFENGLRRPIANNLLAMQRAFEEAGITLTDEPAGIAYSAASAKNGSGTAP